MNRQAQILMIFLWILVVLVILVVSVGQRASMTFKYIRYQKDRQKALYLAKAGINRAIAELEKDKNTYDNLNETWSTGIDSQTQQSIFKNIELMPGSGETFTVTIRDEESKINIDKASKEILTVLLEDFDIRPSEEVAKNILIWRDDIRDDNRVYEELGYAPKADKFTNTEELMLVKGITPQDYQKLRDSITVYGDGLININTTSDRVLNIAVSAVAKKQGLGKDFAQNLALEILEARDNSGGYFKAKTDIKIELSGDKEINTFNELMKILTVKSSNFFIEVKGNAGKIENRVNAVYSRKEKENKFKYWHEE